jgi:uncharacterized membrane protein
MPRPLHPLHAALLAGSVPLFLGVLLTDIAYFNTYEIQWKNFASWLLVGALVFCGLTMLCALIALIRVGWRTRPNAIYLLLLLAAFILGLVNAFVHAGDAWASMPGGLVLAAIDTVLVLAATWLGLFTTARADDLRRVAE